MQHQKTSTFVAARRNATRQATLTGTVRLLWPYIWPADRSDLKLRVFLAVALMLLSKLFTIAIPYSYKWATDAVAGKLALDAVPLPRVLIGAAALTALYGVLRILMAFTQQGRDGLFAAVAMNAVRRLAIEVFEHLHRLSLRFHLERKTGGLTRVLERGRNAIETLIRTSMLTAIPTVVEFAMIVAAMLISFDWRYVAAISVTVVAYLVFTTLATNWRIGIRRSMNESDTDANTKAIDSLLNFETVKYFGAEGREAARYDKAMARYERMSVRTYVSLAVLNAGQAFIFTLGLIVVLLMCVAEVRNGTKTVGAFVLVNLIMLQLYQPLNFMGMVYRDIRQAIIDVEAMFVILAQNPEVEDIPGAQPLKVSAGAVRFENVDFAYDPERPILRGVSFEAPAGHTIAIVGPSGAGKSTISRLLFRFYEPNAGRILIDGQNIAAVTQSSLRAAIGMVPQDTVLFNDTILYNIRYGRDGANEREVIAAAENAQIDRFIRSLPQGYDAPVGERGLKLSGGEKQRVAIARTMLKAPPILVLDEATSALDSFTEREIQSALERVSRGRTTIVIAHRLSTVVNADEILVLDKGVIAERGSHQELLERGGIYSALWSRQRQVDAAAGIAAAGRPRRRPRARRAYASARAVTLRNVWRHECARFVFERWSMSIVKSLRGQLAPIHPEGYKFVAGFAVATLILWWLWAPLGWLGLIATLWCAYFFRDPARVTPVRSDLVIAPADGVVSFAGFAAPPPELGLGMAPLQRVSIFMSVFDCHVNRAPVQGRVAQIVYHPGLFLSADLDKASEDNERNSLVIDAPSGRFGVVQIAGLVARRIVCFTHEGALVGAGERIGLIRFGSRVDVYLPAGAHIVVGVDSRAIAGETVIAQVAAEVEPPPFQRS